MPGVVSFKSSIQRFVGLAKLTTHFFLLSRNRKVRCDGAKPVCFNCRRRDPTIVVCNYDQAPKRRGQDKVPGTRIRSSAGSRKPRPSRRTQVEDGASAAENIHKSLLQVRTIVLVVIMLLFILPHLPERD